MFIGKHATMELGNPNQGPGRHREGQLDQGRFGLSMGRQNRCDAEYYLFEVIGERDNNDPNSRR